MPWETRSSARGAAHALRRGLDSARHSEPICRRWQVGSGRLRLVARRQAKARPRGGAHAAAAHDAAPVVEAPSKSARKMPRAAVLGMAGVATAAAVALGAAGIYYVISRDATPTAPAASGSSEPAVSDATDATDGATTDPNDTAADAAQAMPEATGAPAHIMQLAELLAMDSSRLDGFLTDQGLYRYTGGRLDARQPAERKPRCLGLWRGGGRCSALDVARGSDQRR